MNTDQKTWYNVALLPSTQSANVLMNMSERIASTAFSEIILGKPHLAHLSAYQAQFASLETLEASIDAVRSKIMRLELPIHAFGSPGMGFIFADTKNTEELSALHNDLLENVSPHRIPMSPEELEELEKAGRPAAQIEKLEQYGMALSGNAYRPHVTIGKVCEESSDRVIELLQKSFHVHTRLEFNRIGILDCDPTNGSASNVLVEYLL